MIYLSNDIVSFYCFKEYLYNMSSIILINTDIVLRGSERGDIIVDVGDDDSDGHGGTDGGATCTDVFCNHNERIDRGHFMIVCST